MSTHTRSNYFLKRIQHQQYWHVGLHAHAHTHSYARSPVFSHYGRVARITASYSRGLVFKSRLEDLLSWGRSEWFSLVLSGVCQDTPWSKPTTICFPIRTTFENCFWALTANIWQNKRITTFQLCGMFLLNLLAVRIVVLCVVTPWHLVGVVTTRNTTVAAIFTVVRTSTSGYIRRIRLL
jgi:hypothetical protein